jgi:hypothetical protein
MNQLDEAAVAAHRRSRANRIPHEILCIASYEPRLKTPLRFGYNGGLWRKGGEHRVKPPRWTVRIYPLTVANRGIEYVC